MIVRLLRLATLVCAVLSGGAGVGHAQEVRQPHIVAELVGERTSIAPGETWLMALRLRSDSGWHTYWKNPGDAGSALAISWRLPAGFSTGPLRYPTPEYITVPPLAVYGYHGEVFLLAEVTAPAGLAAGTAVPIGAKAEWVVCEAAECIAGEAEFSVPLTVSAAAGKGVSDPRWEPVLRRVQAALPRPGPGWAATAARTADGYTLRIVPPAGWTAPLDPLRFLPAVPSTLEHAAPQRLARDGDAWTLALTRSPYAERAADTLDGVLVLPAALRDAVPGGAIALRVPVTAAPALAAAGTTGAPGLSLVVALGLALVGGLLLNLMPCVFPVVSLKALHFAKLGESGRRRAWHHGLAFLGGVVATCWALVGILLALRSAGTTLGWGFQLQSPLVVTALVVLLVVLALNLLGVFEIGLALTRVRQPESEGLWGAFGTGALTTIVATPCTAPFMGVALGWALAAPATHAVLVFTALALGIALPYLLLAASPALIARLPRPGAWMETFRQAIAFPLLATAAWLVWVLAQQTGVDAVLRVLLALVLIAVACWIVGRWPAFDVTPRMRGVTRGGALLFLAGGLALAWPVPVTAAGEGTAWETWTPARVAERRAEGKAVFVDFTAAWCLSCKVNERVALQTDAVVARFRDLGVATLKADWTTRDSTIAAALADHGRSGVPLYLLYPADPAQAPVVLPALLTPAIVLDALAGVVPGAITAATTR